MNPNRVDMEGSSDDINVSFAAIDDEINNENVRGMGNGKRDLTHSKLTTPTYIPRFRAISLSSTFFLVPSKHLRNMCHK